MSAPSSLQFAIIFEKNMRQCGPEITLNMDQEEELQRLFGEAIRSGWEQGAAAALRDAQRG